MAVPRNFSTDGAVGAGGGDGSFGSTPSPPAGPPSGGTSGYGSGYGSFSGRSSFGGGGRAFSGVGGAGGLSFSQGGAIDDSEDGTQQQDALSKALESIDGVLAFGRKLHGLGGGGNDEGGAINTAGAMPMIPGNQSETPGPYKPGGGGQKLSAAMPMIPGNQSETPGPYKPGGGGQKLADADNDGDSDQPGAIDTDEGTA